MTELYHELAIGRVDDVAEALDSALAEREVPRWYDDLLRIVAAPVRAPAREGSAEDNCLRMTGGARRSVSRVSPSLVAALQLHTDPLGDPTHELCPLIAQELAALSDRVSRDQVFLLRRRDEFTACAERWR